MGSKHSRQRPAVPIQFHSEELAEIDGLFAAITGGLETISNGKTKRSFPIPINSEMLQAYAGEALPEKMVVKLYDAMRKTEPNGNIRNPSEYVTKEQFVNLLSQTLKGKVGDKSLVIQKMLNVTPEKMKMYHIKEFTEDLISSVVHVLDFRNELKGWIMNKSEDMTSSVKALAEQLLLPLKQKEKHSGEEKSDWDFDGEGKRSQERYLDCIDGSCIEEWLFKVPQINTFLNMIVRRGFLVLNSQGEFSNFIPECKDAKELKSLLNIPAIIYINSHLPLNLQQSWRLVYSSHIHGLSFTQFCTSIIDKGPCLLVIKDSDGFIFGGFSSHSLELKSQFQGDSRCFLYTISPNIAVYKYSGYNDHYMYLNNGQHTIPNGLGMGGQFEHFGLWIDSDFGKGHSKANPRCSTYNSPQLSANEYFHLEALEVWALGSFVPTRLTKKRSVLDSEKEVHTLLEMIGKRHYSDVRRRSSNLEDESD
ncbi:MTOR-associated protein MEAK7 [Monodelphis domestica]|uniref:MTOR-associated protein MEAK7 n=1 Tax=Monodelphis domestica TaxID=13616 RepID=F6WKU9_MONDO|nr:MTOR-associated protein MEAK7 [Monodelphis domestica]XP_016283275.1 MTOR-associated protein MEAK7 [Monodelphis domestica]